MNAREAVEAINSKKLANPRDADNVVSGLREVDTIDMDEHRWYVTGTMVYQLGNEFIGVWGVVSLKSEGMSYGDCCVDVEAFEMEAVPSTTYRRKSP